MAKDLLFFSNPFSDIVITVYSVTDINIANEIIEVCVKEYKNAHKAGHAEIGIRLYMFKISDQERRNISLFDRWLNDYYFVELILKGEENE